MSLQILAIQRMMPCEERNLPKGFCVQHRRASEASVVLLRPAERWWSVVVMCREPIADSEHAVVDVSHPTLHDLKAFALPKYGIVG